MQIITYSLSPTYNFSDTCDWHIEQQAFSATGSTLAYCGARFNEQGKMEVDATKPLRGDNICRQCQRLSPTPAYDGPRVPLIGRLYA